MDAIRSLTEMVEASQGRVSEYGTIHRVEGELIGVNGVDVPVITVWLRRTADRKFQFITLVPGKEQIYEG